MTKTKQKPIQITLKRLLINIGLGAVLLLGSLLVLPTGPSGKAFAAGKDETFFISPKFTYGGSSFWFSDKSPATLEIDIVNDGVSEAPQFITLGQPPGVDQWGYSGFAYTQPIHNVMLNKNIDKSIASSSYITYKLTWGSFLGSTLTGPVNDPAGGGPNGSPITTTTCHALNGYCWVDIQAPLTLSANITDQITASFNNEVSTKAIVLKSANGAFSLNFAPQESFDIPGTNGALTLVWFRRHLFLPGIPEYDFTGTKLSVTAPSTCTYFPSLNGQASAPLVFDKIFYQHKVSIPYGFGLPSIVQGITIPFDPQASKNNQPQPCAGSFTIQTDIPYEVQVNYNGVFAPPVLRVDTVTENAPLGRWLLPNPFTVSRTDTVKVLGSTDEFTKLSVTLYDANTKQPIGAFTGPYTITMDFVDPAEKTSVATLNPGAQLLNSPTNSTQLYSIAQFPAPALGIDKLWPTFYTIQIPPPSGYKDDPSLKSTSFDMTKDPAPIGVYLCPVVVIPLPPAPPDVIAAALAKDAACTASSNLTTTTPGTTNKDFGICDANAVSTDSIGLIGLVLTPVYQITCSVASAIQTWALPLLDVNISMPTGQYSSDGKPILQQREMGEGGAIHFGSPNEVYSIWAMAVNIANAAVVLAIVFIGFMIIMRLNPSNYALKMLVSELPIKIFLANASYIICAFCFDIFKVLALIIRDTLLGMQGASIAASTTTNIVGTMVTALSGIGGGLFVAVGASGAMVTSAVAGCLLSTITATAAALIGLLAAVMGRLVFLYLSVLLAPIVFTLSIIPEFKNMFKQWWTSFMQLLAIYPLATLIYYLLIVLANAIGKPK